MKKSIQHVRIDSIRVINPRLRDKHKFQIIVDSIRTVGLKKPIKISRNEEPRESVMPYDLICGQGRIEAFLALGYDTIPAEIVSVPREDRLLMSLVENMARRFPHPSDLMVEIERLKALGHSNALVGKKLGISGTLVSEYMGLRAKGEERLLIAALNGTIPIDVAAEIARADTIESQRGLLKAYQSKQLNQNAIRTVRRLMEERRFIGKGRNTGGGVTKQSLTSAEGMVKAYRTESQRMRGMVRRAKLCEEKILFLENAFATLFKDENFSTLLAAENVLNMPEFFLNRIKTMEETIQ